MKINYNGWISTPSHLRYDKMCSVFNKLADLAADDEASTQATMEWMESQLIALRKSNTKPSCGSNIYVEDSVQEQFPNFGEAATVSSAQILDPRCSQTKEAPRKLRKKGPLETSSKKAKKVPLERSSKKEKVWSNLFFTYLIM